MGKTVQRPQDALARSRPNTPWTWHRALRRGVELVRHEGVRSLWFGILGETVYRRVILMERLLDQPITAPTARLPVAINLLQATEVDEYAEFRRGTDIEETRRRLAAGHRAFVARYQGQIVHAGWAAVERAWIDYLACDIVLAANEVFQYGSYTVPGFRGLNIAAVRISEMMRYFRDAGFRRIVAAVVPHNLPAFAPLVKTGYQPYSLMGYIEIGRWRRDFRRARGGPCSR